MKRLVWLVTVALVCALLPSEGGAWDTKAVHDVGWWGPYLDSQGGANEHSTISSLTLSAMGVDVFTIGPGSDNVFEISDWNATWFRDDLYLDSPRGDDVFTIVEERHLPSPAHFGGMPDYSWTVYDWINKHRYCPPVPAGMVDSFLLDRLSDEPCHAFKGWMGVLNANHFGTQAKLTYLKAHATAMSLARRANDMRQRLLQQPGAYEEYRRFVQEAELEALLYEGYAQHYLQDRWSVGHMWERWGSSDLNDLSDPRPEPNLVIGSFAGLIHGAQGLTTVPDPMCSPILEDGTVVPMQFSQAAGTPLDGIGDYRLTENVTGTGSAPFGLGNFDGYSYDVRPQMSQMLECSKRGWAEVIRSFAQGDDGAYGAWEIVLDPSTTPPPSRRVDDRDCWENWATNRSFYAGLHGSVYNPATLARMGLTFLDGTFGLGDAGDFRPDTIEVFWDLWRWSRDDPNGTQAASGDFSGLLGAAPGGSYDVASWLEPEDFENLPEVDESTGGDRRAIFGFFNRAHADYFCDEDLFAFVIDETRGSEQPTDQAFCRYFADRAYKGTRPEYGGAHVEKRETDAVPDAPGVLIPIDPICGHYGLTESGDDRDAIPYYVHPGYVSDPGQRMSVSPVTGSNSAELGYLTVSNWCDRVPVIDVDNERDIAATVHFDDDSVVLTGMNFGVLPGQVFLYDSAQTELEVRSWSEGTLELSLPGDLGGASADLPDGSSLAHLFVVAGDAPRRSSVGLAYLRILPTSARAPVVTDVQFVPAAAVPDDTVRVEVTVVDPEGDLGGSTTVTVVSDIFAATPKVFTAADGTSIGPDTVLFAGDVAVAWPRNDRSSCAPATWEAQAFATDDIDFDPALAPDALTGPTFDTVASIDNVAPTVACDHDEEQVLAAAPGEPLPDLFFPVTDGNNDGLCLELHASAINVSGVQPFGLLTEPPLTSAAFEAGVSDPTTGLTTFRMEPVSIDYPHSDNDDPGDEPYVITVSATDDAGLSLGGVNRRCAADTPEPTVLVRVLNRPPLVVTGRSSHHAVHPGRTIEVTFTAEVDDPNTFVDVVSVVLDASEIGGPADAILTQVVGSATWAATVGVTPPDEQGPRNVTLTAIDDDGESSHPFTVVIEIGNLPPIWGGGGYAASIDPLLPPEAWSQPGYQLYECDPVRIGTIFIDPNHDALDVKCIIEGEGRRTELRMTRSSGTNVWTTDTMAPAAGTYTVSFKATETSVTPPLSTEAQCCTMEVLPRPDGCDPRTCIGDGVVRQISTGGRAVSVSSEGYAVYVGGSAGEAGMRTLFVHDLCANGVWSLDLPVGAFVSGKPQIGNGEVIWSDDRAARNDYRLYSWAYSTPGASTGPFLDYEATQTTPSVGDGVLAWVEDVAGEGRYVHAMALPGGVPQRVADAPTALFVDVRFGADAGRVSWLDDANALHVAQAPGWVDTVVMLDRTLTNTVGLSLDDATLAVDDFETTSGRFEIFLVDLATGAVTQLPGGASGRTRPYLEGPLTVFEELIGPFGPEQKIVLYDPGATVPARDLSDGTTRASSPTMEGSFIAWSEEGVGVFAVQLP